jgi:hypothetical protein
VGVELGGGVRLAVASGVGKGGGLIGGGLGVAVGVAVGGLGWARQPAHSSRGGSRLAEDRMAVERLMQPSYRQGEAGPG